MALDILADDPSISAAEVCASWCEQQIVRIRHDTDTPGEAIQAPQLSTTCGVGLTVILEDRDGRRVGFASEPDDLSSDGIPLVVEQAKTAAVAHPAGGTLPQPVATAPALSALSDATTLALQPADMTGLATEALNGALATLQEAGYVTHLQVRGQVRSRKEHLLVGNTHGLLAGETTAALAADLLVHLPHEYSQGAGYSTAAHVRDFAAYDAGVDAARQALETRGGIRPAGGDYAVIFSPRAMAAFLYDALVPGLSLDTVAANASPFATAYGQDVASPLMTLRDEGARPALVGSHAMTGEGLPSGTTSLIEHGRLVGFLADTYHSQALAAHFPGLAAHNGMRYALQNQSFATRPGIFPTNLCLTGTDPVTLDTLLTSVAEGIYVGDLWNTFLHGPRLKGDFSSTVVGPSFQISQGRLTQPILPGSLSLHANVRQVLRHIMGLADTPQVIAAPTLQSIVLTPAVWCRRGHFVRVAT
jgi:predicted Zn-dependent protease